MSKLPVCWILKRKSTNTLSPQLLGGGLVLLLLLAGCGAYWWLGSFAEVWLDNGTDQVLTIHVDSQPEATVSPYGRQRVSLWKGQRKVQALNVAGEVVSDQQVTLRSGGKYVLNPGGRHWYVVETATYRPLHLGLAKESTERDLGAGEWHDVTSIEHVFEPLPQTAKVKQVVRETRRSALAARPVESFYPQIWLDNGVSEELRLTVDGVVVATVHPDSWESVRVPFGKRRIGVLNDEAAIIDRTETISPRGKYIVNPQGQRQYQIESREYSTSPTFHFGQPAEQPEDMGNPEWLDASNVDYVLESLPESIQLQVSPGPSGGFGFDKRRALQHLLR